MRLLTAADMRTLDRLAITSHGIPSVTLMRRAGCEVAQSVRRLARATGTEDLTVVLVAGRGNNGGDALAAAGFLLDWGYKVQVRLACDAKALRGDARHFAARLPQARLVEGVDAEVWDADRPAELPHGTVFVDGVLGTGGGGTPRGTIAAAIRWLQRAAGVGPVVSIDLPSGFEADSGRIWEPCVRADVTVCLALPKTGLRAPEALEVCGRVEIADIGFPRELTGEPEGDGWGWIAEPEIVRMFPARPRDAHKGQFGRVLIVGGSARYSGAVVLAARGALRAGAGLVTVLTPSGVAPIVSGGVPEAIVLGAGEPAAGSLDADALAEAGCDPTGFDAVVAGPGLTTTAGGSRLLERLLGASCCRLLLDADALNLLEGRPERLRETAASITITPHPGEAARLLRWETAQVQSDRATAARTLIERSGATVVLKGAGTLVGTPGRGLHQTLAGNPGMATAGSGDVLAGLMGGLLAQGMNPLEAALVGVWWHASAGDLGAWRGGQESLTAQTLLEQLGPARSLFLPRVGPH